MNRPLLRPDLSPETFSAWYWLKKEWQDFCSAQNWPTGGSKQDLMARVMAGSLGRPLPVFSAMVPKGALRDPFKNPESRTLGQALAVYQSSHVQRVSPIQRQFQLNQHIRDFFAQHPHATRAQALQAWRAKCQMPQALVFSADNE